MERQRIIERVEAELKALQDHVAAEAGHFREMYELETALIKTRANEKGSPGAGRQTTRQ